MRSLATNLIHTRLGLVVALFLLVGGYVTSTVLQAQTERKGTIINVDGVVDVQKAGTNQWVPAERGMEVGSGDSLRTTIDSIVDIKMDDGGALRLAEETNMTIEALAAQSEKARFLFFMNRPVEAQKAKLKLSEGKVLASLKKLPNSQSTFRVETPQGVAGVRGTAWGVETRPAGSLTLGEIAGLPQGAEKGIDTVSVQQGGATYHRKEGEVGGIDGLLQPLANIFRGDFAADEDRKPGAYVAEGTELTITPQDHQLKGLPEEEIVELRELQRTSEQIAPDEPVKPSDTTKQSQEYIHDEIIGDAGGSGGSIKAGRGAGETNPVEEKQAQGASDTNLSSGQ